MPTSVTHLVLIPSYDSGPLLARTIVAARARWAPVWVVIDGSTDGSGAEAVAMAAHDPGLFVLCLGNNRGKGAAIEHGLRAAAAAGFSHALTMDADMQHPADLIPAFMAASAAAPEALVMGRPVFGVEAPWLRVAGRRLSNWLAAVQCGRRVGDVLFGMRVYPVRALLNAFGESAFMRRFDFDPEAAVRLAWRGTPLVEMACPVRYLGASEGGVSHFDYRRDNVLLARMHLRLLLGRFFWRGRSAPSPLAREGRGEG